MYTLGDTFPLKILFTDKPFVRAPPPREIRLRASKNAASKLRGFEELPVIKDTAEEKQHTENQSDTEGQSESGPDDVKTGTIVDKLCNSYQWSTTQERAAEGAHLTVTKVPPPSITIEDNSDAVTLRPKRFESKPGQWQQLTNSWNRFQTTEYVGEPAGKIGSRGFPPLNENSRCLPPVKRNEENSGKISIEDDIKTLCRHQDLSSTFVRQCPGYAGFVPRSPLRDAPICRNQGLDSYMMSTMTASYRRPPSCARKEYSHKSTLSRTVTLTYPYNPYNKVEDFAYFRKDMGPDW